ncbi:hypothetical protein PAXRUDRAFT_18870 [Paxillus rubicundulus Ve08.2h10]|uniref:Uncharacterized protein n=1 Tax=Paxillus rubicundulus Ve08.2h10 TaxID=930991 RepID=A0A0D0D657_9AGAM|nr:hypothetical protein PAXRUDRAFT_18870 [Paxillus rubicundulus Ve08.2h10]
MLGALELPEAWCDEPKQAESMPGQVHKFIQESRLKDDSGESESDSGSSVAPWRQSYKENEPNLESGGQANLRVRDYSYEAHWPPSVISAQVALWDINLTLKPP